MTPTRQALVDALRNNAYQTAAFAEFTATPTVNDWLELRQLLGTRQNLISSNEYALVLWLLFAAGEQYGDGGLWPVVAEKFGRTSLTQEEQERLGRWFRDALEFFDYAIPKGGLRNLRPILVHVGVPRGNYVSLVRFLQTLLSRWGPSIQHWDAEQIAALIPDNGIGTGLHVATVAFLKSQQTEVAEMWSALVEVLRQRAMAGRWKDALDNLPAFLPRDVIEQELRAWDDAVGSTRDDGPTVIVPRFVYQPEVGRVVIEGSDLTNFVMKRGNRVFSLGPCETIADVAVRGLLEPLPPNAAITWSDDVVVESREFYEAKEFPGLWFRGGTGRYFGGIPEPGMWYVFLRGTEVRFPHDMLVEVQSLNWWSLSQEPWRAFRVELRSGQPFKVTIDGKDYTQHLARKKSLQPTLINIDRHGQLLGDAHHGDAVAILHTPPQLRNPKSDPIEVVLESFAGAMHTLTLGPQQSGSWPTLTPGVYRVRFRPTSGRRAYWQPLTNVAYLPGLQQSDATYMDHHENVTLVVQVPEGGQLRVSTPFQQSQMASTMTIQGSTIEPSMRLEWRWQDTDRGPTIAWSVPLVGVRWRLQTKDGLGAWTREPFECDSRKSFELQARLELQTPPNAAVRLGTNEWEPSQQGSCAEYRQELKALTGDVLTLHIDEHPYDVVYLSARPHLTHFDIDAVGKQLRITYAGHIPASAKLFEWNLLAPWEAPLEHARSPQEAFVANSEPTRPRLFALAATRPGFKKRFDVAWDRWHHEYEVLWPEDSPTSRPFWNVLIKLTHQQRQGLKLAWDANSEVSGLEADAVNSWLASIPDTQATLKEEATRWWRRVGPKPASADLPAFQDAFMETLGEGIHLFAEGEPRLPEGGTPVDDELFARTYPLRFFEALRCLRGSLAEYRQQFPDRLWVSKLQEEARFVFCTLKLLDLLPLLEGLPLAARFSLADRHWDYPDSVAVNYRTKPQSVRRCWELLGLEDIELGVPSCPNQYAKWRLETKNENRQGWTCFRANPNHKHSSRLLVKMPNAATLADRTNLQLLLEGFDVSLGYEAVPLLDSLMPKSLQPFWQHYREGIRAKPRVLQIAGVRQTVHTADWQVTASVQQLWELCWHERLYCTRANKAGWERIGATLPQELRTAFLQAPQATCKMLILVEWLRVLFEHGGIGLAARFAH